MASPLVIGGGTLSNDDDDESVERNVVPPETAEDVPSSKTDLPVENLSTDERRLFRIPSREQVTYVLSIIGTAIVCFSFALAEWRTLKEEAEHYKAEYERLATENPFFSMYGPRFSQYFEVDLIAWPDFVYSNGNCATEACYVFQIGLVTKSEREVFVAVQDRIGLPPRILQPPEHPVTLIPLSSGCAWRWMFPDRSVTVGVEDARRGFAQVGVAERRYPEGFTAESIRQLNKAWRTANSSKNGCVVKSVQWKDPLLDTQQESWATAWKEGRGRAALRVPHLPH